MMSTQAGNVGEGRESYCCLPKIQPTLYVADEAETILAQAMKDLTFDELQREQEDLHGVAKSVDKDVDTLNELLKSIQTHLDRIKKGTVYAAVEMRNRAYVSNPDFRSCS